jgi:hypothetical protein
MEEDTKSPHKKHSAGMKDKGNIQRGHFKIVGAVHISAFLPIKHALAVKCLDPIPQLTNTASNDAVSETENVSRSFSSKQTYLPDTFSHIDFKRKISPQREYM